ncbi:hypothetical protein MNBD_NITROSPINAE01-1220, partial [hydrothermal vent metagenome]
VCAWRATCGLKFKYEASENHCKEFTRDITLGDETKTASDSRNTPDK